MRVETITNEGRGLLAETLPDPESVRERLATAEREVALLKGLLRLSERAAHYRKCDNAARRRQAGPRLHTGSGVSMQATSHGSRGRVRGWWRGRDRRCRYHDALPRRQGQ
jgi:hypothetical protein